MKYIVSWSLPYSTFNAAAARFLQAGGLPPAPVKLIGRWHGMNNRGFAVVEASEPKALYSWVAEWSDMIAIEATPCLEDAEVGEVLKGLKR